MKSAKSSLGKKGEKKAGQFLVKRGYTIVGKNQRVGGVEIDLLAQKGDVLCLVEVKARSSSDFGLPEEYVDFRKQRRMVRAAQLLLSRKEFRDLQIRLDVISVLFSGRDATINHIENAFEPE